MTPTPEVQERLRQYLLGQLGDDGREEIEKDLLTNDELFQELLVIEDEIIDDYISGDLTAINRAAFESHFLSTPDRHDQLKFGRAFSRYLSSQSAGAAHEEPSAPLLKRSFSQLSSLSHWGSAFFSSPLRIAVATVIAIAIALGVWQFFFRQSEIDKGLVALNAAYREQRPTESRISNLDYAPFIVTRGSESGKADQNELRRAELTLLDALARNPTPTAYHALGKVYLAKKDFDKAIENFDKALQSDPKNAKLYSDLGAAWLEKGKFERNGPKPGQNLEDYARSLEYISRALEVNPNLLEALFNLALVHQLLMLPEQAADDWRSYLAKDPNSKWADEARQSLKLLEEEKLKPSQTKEKLLQDFLRAHSSHDDEFAWHVISISRDAISRKLIWEQLLDRYLEASSAGRADQARDDLKALAYEGELEDRRAGDRYVTDLNRFYQDASKRQKVTLAQARELMRQGHENYFKGDLDNAINSYTNASRMFVGIGDQSEFKYASYWIGNCNVQVGKTQEGLSILKDLALSLQKENYQWLLMRSLYVASTACHNLDEYSKAINYNRRALSVAERINDPIGIFDASNVLIFQYVSAGNHTQALEYVRRSLSVMNECPLNETQAGRYYSIVAVAFDDADLSYAAIDYEKEALKRAIEINLAQNISARYARLGVMYARLGKFEEALRSLDLAYTAAKSCPDESTRREMMGFSSLETGHLYRERGQFSKAISYYDQTISVGDNIRFQNTLYEAHKNRLFCYLALKDDYAAADELRTTLNLAEKYRSTIVEGDNRNDFFNIQQTVYDLAIDFAYSRQNDPQTAFQYSEDSRSRSLLDSIIGHASISEKQADISFESVTQPLSLADIRRRLPANAQILQYAVLSDKVLIWILSNTQFTAVEKKISQRDLEKAVNDYLQFIETPTARGDEIQSRAKELYDILIRPAESLLDRNKAIYLIPDKILTALPFGTLISPTSGKFLLEDYLLETSPSASLLVILSEMAHKKEGHHDERVLSIGDPRFDADAFPTLVDLPAAGREAEQVAACYSSSRVLTGLNATRQAVNSEMPIADVLHFALHSVADEVAPMQSKLVLAKDRVATDSSQESDGSIQAYEIYRLKLPHTRLAVLSACHTGAERYYRGEGMISLARPFLAAGVPLVVVSLWAVDSDATAQLMISFHQHRKQENLSSAEALRRAQLDMLKRPEEPLHNTSCWGAFELIGGDTTY